MNRYSRKLAFTFLLILTSSPTQAFAHQQTLEQKINRLHVRVLEAERYVGSVMWVAVAAYLTAAVASGAVCSLWLGTNIRSARLWFLAGLLLPVVAVGFATIKRTRRVASE